ncbi:MAG: hypothetical protein SPJ55_02880 [Treponema sp.]|nr:hypothetical protein [Treponema sp.]
MRNTFKDVFFHSENDEPAIQFPGHWEYWEKDEENSKRKDKTC